MEAGLAIAEMVASLSKPTVSLVLSGSHSIGIPIAVSTDYSFIVPTGTILVGEEAVKEGIINEVGGIRDALKKLHSLIDADKENGEIK